MKKTTVILPVLISGLFLICCKSSSKKNRTRSLMNVMAPVNQMVVIAPQKTWKVGFNKFIRDTLISPVKGMFYSEPEFSVIHFSDLHAARGYKRYPNFIRISKGKPSIRFKQNVLANGQTVVHVFGENLQDIEQLLMKKRKSIFDHFHQNDKRQWRINHAGKYHGSIPELRKMGITLKIPIKYVKVDWQKSFVHYQYNASNRTRNRSADFFVIKKPYSPDTISMDNILGLRDLIGRKYIKGSSDESYMQTDPLLNEYLHRQIVKNTPKQIVYKTTGLWSMKNLIEGGPFVNYVIVDKKRDRLFMFDGFALVSTSGNTNARNIFYRRELLTEMSFIFDTYSLLQR